MRAVPTLAVAAVVAGLVVAVAGLAGLAGGAAPQCPGAGGSAACACANSLNRVFYHGSLELWPGIGFWNTANTITALANYDLRVRAAHNATPVFAAFLEAALEDHVNLTFLELRADGSWDDTQWWVLALLDMHELTGGRKYLSVARGLFDNMLEKAWSNATCGGGVVWNAKVPYKNAITNGLAILSAARLHEALLRTTPGAAPSPSYLDKAMRVWAWLRQSGMINAQGLLNDGLTDACTNNHQTTWTYNQGVLMGGLAHLAALTNDTSLLHAATAIANASMSVLVTPGKCSHGPVLTEIGGLHGMDALQFKGVWARHAFLLATRLPSNNPVAAFLSANRDCILALDRNSDGLFTASWVGPPGRTPSPAVGVNPGNASTLDVVAQTAALDLLTAAEAL